LELGNYLAVTIISQVVVALEALAVVVQVQAVSAAVATVRPLLAQLAHLIQAAAAAEPVA
jgi:hypothetical protein